LKVYRNLKALPAVFASGKDDQKSLEPRNPILPLETVFSDQKVTADFSVQEDVLARFVVPFYPGWELYCAGCSTHGTRRGSTSRARSLPS
jgi:hypothetical protein